MFVPVVDKNQHPLMPTTAARARRWITRGKATPFGKGGIFCVRLNAEPSDRKTQPVAVGIDPGSKREGYSVLSAAHTYLNIQAKARDGVKEAEKESTRMRRTRRNRRTPCRKPRQNRHQGKKRLPPSTRARWEWKLRLARFLCQIVPVSVFVVEDIEARTLGKKRWDQRFSPLEVGKRWFYEELEKLAEVWEAHCVDAWCLAYRAVGGNATPDNRRMVCIAPFVWHHRQLHRFRPEKGGKRKPYGGTLVKHPKWGKATIDADGQSQRVPAHQALTLEDAPGSFGPDPCIPGSKKGTPLSSPFLKRRGLQRRWSDD